MGLEQFNILGVNDLFKPFLIASLYTAVGLSGWSAYSFISQGDTSLDSIKSFAIETNDKLTNSFKEDNTPVYRYKDENGRWTYSDKPLEANVANSYDKEMQLLKSLPQEVMPTKAFTTNPKVFIGHDSSGEPESKMSELMKDAQNVVKMLEDRNQFINDLSSTSK